MSDQTATKEELEIELKAVRERQREIVNELNRRYGLQKQKQEGGR